MKTKFLFFITLFLIFINNKAQVFDCNNSAKITESNIKSAWSIVGTTYNKYEIKKTGTEEDKSMHLCLLTKLESYGDLKATSLLAQGYLYGLNIYGGKNLKLAEKYLSKLLYFDGDYQSINLSKNNLVISISNLYNELEKEDILINILKKRATTLNDEVAYKQLGNIYRYKPGKLSLAMEYYGKSCEFGLDASCNLIKDFARSPEYFNRQYAPPPPPYKSK